MSNSLNFEKRMRKLDRVHGRMYAKGIVRKIGKDGLISAYPRRRIPQFPLKAFLMLFIAAFLYKATLFAWLGEDVYNERVATLASGATIEQGGAWVMQADPATRFLAGLISSVLPGS